MIFVLSNGSILIDADVCQRMAKVVVWLYLVFKIRLQEPFALFIE